MKLLYILLASIFMPLGIIGYLLGIAWIVFLCGFLWAEKHTDSFLKGMNK